MRLSLRRLSTLIKKELYQITRDPSSLIVAFILPLILIFLFGYAMNLDAAKNRIGLVVEGVDYESNLLAQSFRNSQYFDIYESKNRKFIESLLMEGKIRAMVVIPFYFEKDLLTREKSAPIQVITDGSEPNTANLLSNYARGAWQNWLQQRALSRGEEIKVPILSEQRVWYNPASISHNFLLPGSIATIMTIIGTLLTALVVAREWERGTMEALMATPVTILELVLGKMIPYYFLGLGSLIICVSFSVFIFHVPLRGSLWLLFVVSSLFLVAALSLGLLISSIARNQFVAAQISLYVGFLPAFLLSGFIFEINSMPDFIQVITYGLHARYFVSSLQTLFLVGDVGELILMNSIGILLIGTMFTFIIMKKIRKRLD